MRSTKNISITMPTAMVKEAERIAKRENRTMNELVREALRQYKSRRGRTTQEELRMVLRIINEVKRNPLTPEELRAENKRLMQYGAQQTRRAGVKERDITRVIRESRVRRSWPMLRKGSVKSGLPSI